MSSETHGVTFEKFSSRHKQEFVDLNLAWLRESFSVEPHDVAVLEDCEVGPDDDDGITHSNGRNLYKRQWYNLAEKFPLDDEDGDDE